MVDCNIADLVNLVIQFYSFLNCEVCEVPLKYLVILACLVAVVIFFSNFLGGPGQSFSSCLLEWPRSELAQVSFFSLACLNWPRCDVAQLTRKTVYI